MSKLSYAQNKVLDELSSGKTIYVFQSGDKTSYGYKLDDTSCRLYLTLTCRSLIKRGLVKHSLSVDNSACNDYIGVLELVEIYEKNSNKYYQRY